MMTCHSGDRGTSKTYHLVKRIMKMRKKGFLIISNVSTPYAHFDGSKLTPDEFIGLILEVLHCKLNDINPFDLSKHFKHDGIFIAFDEAHLYLSSDMYKRYQDDKRFQALLLMLSQARKTNIFIEYTVQYPAKIDINFRRYTDKYFDYRMVIPIKVLRKIMRKDKRGRTLEERYLFPLVIKVRHELPDDRPHIRYPKNRRDLESTVVKSSTRFLRSGWMDPFPYKAYNSRQVIGVPEVRMEYRYFDALKFLKKGFGREWLKTPKFIIGFPSNEDKKPDYDYVPIIEKLKPERASVTPSRQVVKLLNNNTITT